MSGFLLYSSFRRAKLLCFAISRPACDWLKNKPMWLKFQPLFLKKV